MKSFIITLLLASLSVSSCAQSEKEISRVENGLRAGYGRTDARNMNLQERMDFYGIPGVSIAFIDNLEIGWVRAYGVLDAQNPAPVNPESLFQTGSIGKPVFAAAALQMVDEGLLDLDGEVNPKLHSWKIPENSFTRRTPVTLRHLLSHTGGVTLPGVIGYRVNEPLPDLIEIMNGVPPANTPPIHVDRVPGTAHKYSSGGYIIAQILMTDQSPSENFEEIIRRRIFDPVGMSHSTLQLIPEEREAGVASGHRYPNKPIPGGFYLYPETGIGEFWSTPTDMALFLIEIMKGYNMQSNTLLSSQMIQVMATPVMDNYGLGFEIGNDGGDRFYFMHRGAVEGFQTCMIGYPIKGQGVVIMTNGDHGYPLIQEILKSISIEYKWIRGIYL